MSQLQQSDKIRVVVSPQEDGTVAAPGPDRILTGHVLVSEGAFEGVERVEIQYRGVEVVGGTLEDYEDDSLDGLQPHKGVRALNKVYFDERLVVWQQEQQNKKLKNDDDVKDTSDMKLPFSIAFPCANYPTAAKSVCVSAPSQSFEIAYHIVGWLVGPNGTVVGRVSEPVSFVPLLNCQPSTILLAPATRTGYDDRGKECLVTRVTLSQTDYMPGDQVVGGVHIECLKSNRTIRKAESQLRQRVECRMRRTFSSAEIAEFIAGGSRPASARPPSESDESDVLWCRYIDIGQVSPLKLTNIAVGLAANAASAAAASACSLSMSQQASASAVTNASQVSEMGAEGGGLAKRDSGIIRSMTTKTSGNRSCSANVHTNVPASTHIIPGHFLLFSYELLIEVTMYSLTRGTQKVSTCTPLGSYASRPTTPGSTCGFELLKQVPFQKALAEAHGGNNVLSASVAGAAAGVVQSDPPAPIGLSGMADGQEVSESKVGRFSVGAFTSVSAAVAVAVSKEGLVEIKDEGSSNVRYSAFKPVPVSAAHRDNSRSESVDIENGDAEVQCVATVAPLPNAVEQLRFRCKSSLAFVPKIFAPAVETDIAAESDVKADVKVDAAAEASAGKTDAVVAEADKPDNVAVAVAVAEGGAEPVEPAIEDVAAPAALSDDSSNVDEAHSVSSQDIGAITATDFATAAFAAASAAVASAAITTTAIEPINDENAQLPQKRDSNISNNSNDSGTADSGIQETDVNADRQSCSGSSSDFDLAGAVYAAAEKVLNDKEWDRPISYYVASSDVSGAGKQFQNSGIPVTGTFADSDTDMNDPIQQQQPVLGEGGNSEGGEFADSIGNRVVGDGLGAQDVEDAINELAPTKHKSDSNRSSVSGSSGVKDFMQGIDFGDVDGGPEFTGMLSADPNKLGFGASLLSTLDENNTTGSSPAVTHAEADGKQEQEPAAQQQQQQQQQQPQPQPKSSLQYQRITNSLRRSISMPGSRSSASAKYLHTDAHSPGSTVIKPAFDSVSESMLVTKHQKTKEEATRLGGLSPRSVFSAVSSASRINGAGSRAGVFKSLGTRITSWFTKKQ